MRLATLPLLALLTAACGSNADQTVPAYMSSNADGTAASDDIASRIAEAEVEAGTSFQDMTLDERAEVLAARDVFGNVEKPSGSGRALSYDEMIAQARAEEHSGY